MARMKTVSVEAKLDEKFKIDVKAGGHVMVVDQPKAGGGADAGPTPLEYFFASLAGCIGTVARIVANQKRIPLRSIDMKIEGDFDVETLLGKALGLKGTPQEAAQGKAAAVKEQAKEKAEDAAKKAQEHGMRTLEVEVAGPGSGRESALRALSAAGLKIPRMTISKLL